MEHKNPRSGRILVPGLKVTETNKGPMAYMQFYSTEKRDQLAQGSFVISQPFDGRTEDEMKEVYIQMKREQLAKNEDYKAEKRKKKALGMIEELGSQIKGPIQEINREYTFVPPVIHHDSNLRLQLDSRTGNTILILGSSKRGKSTALMWIYSMYFAPDAPRRDHRKYITTLFSVSSQARIYAGYPEVITCEGFSKEQEKIVRLEKYINTKCVKPNKYNFLNIFDDVLSASDSKLFNELMLTYRNSNLSTILSIQYTFLVSKKIRANVNNILLFGFNSDEAIEDVIKTYLKSYFNSRVRAGELFLRSMDAKIAEYKRLTEDHGFFYLHPLSGEVTVHRLHI